MLSDEERAELRKKKAEVYQRRNRQNRLKQKLKALDNIIDNYLYSVGFGSKKMFQKQFSLAENSYKTHEKWRNDYRKARDRNIFYLGSKDETFGNQMCQVSVSSDDTFTLKLRTESAFWGGKKYVTQDGITFKYMGDELRAFIKAHAEKRDEVFPISYRFHRVKNAWYLQAIFTINKDINEFTRSRYGTIGLDYNDGFIELSETDENGNLIRQEHFDLLFHGTGNCATNEIRTVCAKIAEEALAAGKDIIREDLDFNKKKAQMLHGRGNSGKTYNRMLSAFDYSRYQETLDAAGFKRGVQVTGVKAYNTSKIGEAKYSDQKKINVHQAASYVIARRGQGFKDMMPKKKQQRAKVNEK